MVYGFISGLQYIRRKKNKDFYAQKMMIQI